MNKIVKLVSMLGLIGLCGCSSTGKLSPGIVRLGVGTSVSYALIKNPKAVKYVQAVTPVVCTAAAGTNLSPAQVVKLIELSDAKVLKTPEGVLIVNGALLLYTGVWESYGKDAVNKSPELKVYLQATCDGMHDGLGTNDVQSIMVVSPHVSRWPVVE